MKVSAMATLSRRSLVSDYLSSMAAYEAARDADAKEQHWQQAADHWLKMTPDEQEEAAWLRDKQPSQG